MIYVTKNETKRLCRNSEVVAIQRFHCIPISKSGVGVSSDICSKEFSNTNDISRSLLLECPIDKRNGEDREISTIQHI